MTPRGTATAFKVLHQFLSASRISVHAQRQSPSHCQNIFVRQARTRQTSTTRSNAVRSFTTSATTLKKSSGSSKSSRKSPDLSSLTHNDDKHVPNNKATQNRDAEIDPYNFDELDAGIARAVAKLKDALVKTKDAGRVTPEMIEQLQVEINVKGADTGKSSAHKERAKVGELASVVAKGGRTVTIFCAEEAHVKPITAALLASPYSLVPQTTAPHTPGTTASSPNLPANANPLLITVPVPPVTAETRNMAKQEAKRMFDRASTDVRNARGDAQKRFRKMELGKLVIQDELRKAHKAMEEVVKKGQDKVKKVYEGSVKALDG